MQNERKLTLIAVEVSTEPNATLAGVTPEIFFAGFRGFDGHI